MMSEHLDGMNNSKKINAMKQQEVGTIMSQNETSMDYYYQQEQELIPNQMLSTNTFILPLYTPIYIQNKLNHRYLSIPSSRRSLIMPPTTSEPCNNCSSILIFENYMTSSVSSDDGHLATETTKNEGKSKTPLSSSSHSRSQIASLSSPPSLSDLGKNIDRHKDFFMTEKPITRFIYTGDSNFHILEREDLFYHVESLEVLDCQQHEIIKSKFNESFSQKWHIGKCNTSHTYGLIRSIENPKLKLYYDGENVFLKEEKDNVAEMDDGYLWKFVLEERPQYSFLNRLQTSSNTYKTISKNSKLYVTALPNNQLGLALYNSVLTGFLLALNNGNTQFFKITLDGFIESKIACPTDKTGKMVVTWDLEENKIKLAKNENLLNQKWIIVPHHKNHNLFKIHSVYEPIYILDTYKIEKNSLLCIKELEEDIDDLYWNIE
ncbi:hypothetical protein C9374_011204 [Naegleria lovaniensis]|uniref:Uncharacterized protein n=1 Tax=Naegleria lovaniensis TaxID=51637 RepID=A0AA88GES5_NAELO|nr:uncharacterized protein C9374_011204 [Naegleria lovaniensis]KAG2374125.1 hypothetical protein C9374_011204 [Naegleria lovaniensis]